MVFFEVCWNWYDFELVWIFVCYVEIVEFVDLVWFVELLFVFFFWFLLGGFVVVVVWSVGIDLVDDCVDLFLSQVDVVGERFKVWVCILWWYVLVFDGFGD